MARVTFKNKDMQMEVENNTTIVEAIRLAGFSFETPCGGKGSCGKCKVKVAGELSHITEKERCYINNINQRLACTTKILGEVEIELFSKKVELKTINSGYSIDIDIDSDICKIELPKINSTSPYPYAESLGYNVNYTALKKISNIDKNRLIDLSAIVYKDKIIDIIQNDSKIFGVAIDIGTTGISAYLIDISTGEILNRNSSLNPQTEYGGDVLSRITYSINNSGGKEKLKKTIIDKINVIIGEMLETSEYVNNVYRISISANTVMLHMLLGLDTQSISRTPYIPEFLSEMNIKADNIGIEINKEGIVTLLPSASAYVGADIVSGAVATGFNNKKHNSVFIDIGTNGEILAISDGKIVGTSTAAGPAFEGMNISCGCRAEPGAIDTLRIIDDKIQFTTINNEKMKGICGSGLIDLVSELIKNKIILKSGKLNNRLEGELGVRIRDKKFHVTKDIYISQKDIRQVQLAKAAISAGVIMVLESSDLSIKDIEEIVIAGAFGYHLNPESIKTIGIIPKEFNGKINFSGNSSLEGARLSIINKDVLNEMIKLKDQIEVLELSMKEEFQNCFIKELTF